MRARDQRGCCISCEMPSDLFDSVPDGDDFSCSKDSARRSQLVKIIFTTTYFLHVYQSVILQPYHKIAILSIERCFPSNYNMVNQYPQVS